MVRDSRARSSVTASSASLKASWPQSGQPLKHGVARVCTVNANKLDATILIVYMAAITIVGCLFARKEKETLDDFLLADRKANKLLVGVSIFAALFSGATYLGAPAEVYAHSFAYTFVLA